MKRVGSESIKCTHIKYLCAFEVGMCTRRKGAPPPPAGGVEAPTRLLGYRLDVREVHWRVMRRVWGVRHSGGVWELVMRHCG
jgi:hypothetical protein